MSKVLSLETLNLPSLMVLAGATIAQRGRDYYYRRRVTIVEVGSHGATAMVTGSNPTPYIVTLTIDLGGRSMQCDCLYASRDSGVICKHQIAAGLALQDYLRLHPITTWRDVLSGAIKKPNRHVSPGPTSLILFSLTKTHSYGWSCIPYLLAVKHIPEDKRGDMDSICGAIVKLNLGDKARPIRSRSDYSGVLNRTPELITAVGMLTSYYYYEHELPPGMLAYLPSLPLFLGTQRDPLDRVLKVAPGKARFEVEVKAIPGAIQLAPWITLGDDATPFRPESLDILSNDPLWIISRTTLYPIEAPSEIVKPFQKNPELDIPEEDVSEFLEDYFPTLAESVPVRGDLVTWEETDPGLAPESRIYLGETDRELCVSLRFGYAESEVLYNARLPEMTIARAPGTFALTRVRRQPKTEEQAAELILAHGMKRGDEPDLFLLRRSIDPRDFLLHKLPLLREAGFVVHGEQSLTLARVNRSKPELTLTVSSGIDWFDVEAVVHFGEIEVSLKEIRTALKRKERYVKLPDGSIGELPEEWVARYRFLFGLAEETEGGLRLSKAQVTLLDALLSETDPARVDEEFRRRRQRLKDFAGVEPRPVPRGFVGELRHYQEAGFNWLHFLHDYDFGGCLADDMGTGKTIQALAFLLSLRESGHAKTADLLVLPRSLLHNWAREAERFTPSLKVHIHADLDRLEDPREFDQYDLVLTTYGIMLRDIEMLRKYPFHYVIMDESQAIKNPVSQSSKAARLLRGEHRLALTGTPVENTSMDLWSQFAFLNPGLLGSQEFFRKEFAGPIEHKQDGDAAKLLRAMVNPFVLRRSKEQVAPELPARSERILYCDMEPAQRKLYNRTRDYYRAMLLGMIEGEGIQKSRMKVLEGLLRLRQISNHPRLVEPGFRGDSAKLDLLLETLTTLRAEDHKALVFSQFTSMLALVREGLDVRRVPYAYLDGRTKDRQERIDAFQGASDIPFFLISLKAGGVGINLTAADYVIHIDPWWNPAVEQQASDRTHRIGQDKPVFIYKLIARESVEEKILQLQERKQALVSQLITTEGSFLKTLTRQDVEVLFS